MARFVNRLRGECGTGSRLFERIPPAAGQLWHVGGSLQRASSQFPCPLLGAEQKGFYFHLGG
jgi:hypothetical protein